MQRYLPILGTVFFAVALSVFVFAFFIGRLTEDQRWIVSVFFAMFVGIGAGCFTGSANIQHSTVWGLVITAGSGYGAWLLTPRIFPAPKGNQQAFIQLVHAASGQLQGGFTLGYRRIGSDSNSKPGTGGTLTISDLPTGTKKLEVTEFKHGRLRIQAEAKDGIWEFPIDDGGSVVIKVVDKYIPIAEPTKESIIEELRNCGLTQIDILRPALTDAQKAEVVLTVKNHAGREFAIWAYDCWWCFNEPPPGSLTLNAKFMDLVRLIDSRPMAQFKQFASLKSSSGYFALFINYDDNGDPRRQYIGIRNLFDPKIQQLTVGFSDNAEFPFTTVFATQ